MTEAYKTKLAEFIANHVNILDGKHSFQEEEVVRQSIALLLKEKAFTVDELRKQALKEQGIIISWEMLRH